MHDLVGARHALPLPEKNASFEIVHAPFAHYSVSEQTLFPALIKKSNIDLLHVPHFNVPLFCPTPFIVTIHDLILHQYPNQASLAKRIAYRILMKHAVKRSSHIFAVSEYTKGEILRQYGDTTAKKITVTHEGVSDLFRPASLEEKNRIRKEFDLSDSFILYAGACKEHKNVQTLINAAPENLPLILITGRKEIKKLHLKSNVRVFSNVPDAYLPPLMSAASVYVQPSLYEGFGLPVLEAMACGTPVVASNRTSLPEIAGSHAILVEPTEEGLREGIKKAFASPPDQSRGIAHAQSFSWEKMTRRTTEIYAELLKDGTL